MHLSSNYSLPTTTAHSILGRETADRGPAASPPRRLPTRAALRPRETRGQPDTADRLLNLPLHPLQIADIPQLPRVLDVTVGEVEGEQQAHEGGP